MTSSMASLCDYPAVVLPLSYNQPDLLHHPLYYFFVSMLFPAFPLADCGAIICTVVAQFLRLFHDHFQYFVADMQVLTVLFLACVECIEDAWLILSFALRLFPLCWPVLFLLLFGISSSTSIAIVQLYSCALFVLESLNSYCTCCPWVPTCLLCKFSLPLSNIIGYQMAVSGLLAARFPLVVAFSPQLLSLSDSPSGELSFFGPDFRRLCSFP